MSTQVAPFVLALAFERPLALALLAIPVLLLWRALRAPATRVVATSDLDVWRADAADGSAGSPRRPRPVSAAFLCALLALASAALAVAGPFVGAARPVWTCVLDTSASMSLADGGATRRDRAVDAARALAERHGADLAWSAAGGDGATRAAAAEAWPPGSRPRPSSFAAWDVPGALWITDAIPAEPPRFAGWVAAGGAAVPGPVGVDGADRLDWDGTRLVRVAGGAPRATCRFEGYAIEPAREPLARALVAWAGARGVRIADAPGPGDVLVVERAIGGEERAFRAGRDGWSASGRGRAVRLDRGAHPGLEPWLEADGVPLVAAGPGRVVVGWEPGEPSDAAAFAVSWARLLDESALAPDGIVPLEERLAAGPSGSAPPAPADLARRAPWTWALSALAAGLALVALLARRA